MPLTTEEKALHDTAIGGSRIAQRFWSKVDKNGPIPPHVPDIGECWQWLASKDGKGYGKMFVNGKLQQAHRVSWWLGNGGAFPDLLLCHKCDNRRCVRPSHLSLGTAKDNTADMIEKGRASRWSKLTEDDVRRARSMLANGISQSEIGRVLGVSFRTIWAIKHGKIWRSV